jgi:hypothetical protein
MSFPSLPSLPSLPALPAIPTIPTFPALANLPATQIPTLALGSFETGPLEELATADIYKLKSSLTGAASPITSIQELNLKLDTDSLGVKLDAGIATDFLSKMESGYLSFDKDLLTTRILGTSTDFKSTFNELNDAMKKGALLSTFKDKANFLTTTIGGVQSMVNSANIRDVRSLGNFINKYTNTKIFSGQDKGALAGLLGSVITTSSNLGISGAFKAITDTINDNGIIGRVTRGVLPIVMKNSDSKLLREIVSSPAANLINVLSPGFTRDFSRAFTYRGTRAKTLTSFEDIFHSFEKVDSQWSMLNRGGSGSTALNLLTLVSGSKDFQNVVMTGVKYWATEQAKGNQAPVPVDPMYALALSYSEVTVSQAIQRDFPKVALLNSYNHHTANRQGTASGLRRPKNNSVVDPRILKNSLAGFFGL